MGSLLVAPLADTANLVIHVLLIQVGQQHCKSNVLTDVSVSYGKVDIEIGIEAHMESGLRQ